MELNVRFPGGLRVDAAFDGYVVQTDQPLRDGGEASAPSPFDLFLASLATCAGSYVLGYLRRRGLPTADVHLVERVHSDPSSGVVDEIEIEIRVPVGFPDKHLAPMIRSAELCAVKKHIEHPPRMSVVARATTAEVA
ncbi:MAG TPA: OsmC family protein [Anaerolineales bacterium]|nr:OsmC family protein [Anaerolineales bacterium]